MPIVALVAVFSTASGCTSGQAPSPKTPPSTAIKVDFDDKSYRKAFDEALTASIKETLAGNLDSLKDRKIADKVWDSKRTIPGFTTSISIGGKGDLLMGAFFTNLRDPDKTDVDFDRFAEFVEESLRVGNADLSSGTTLEEIGTWLVRTQDQDRSGHLTMKIFEHSRLPVQVTVLRQPAMQSLDGKMTVWDFTILIHRKH